jgi:hypothetical protein
VVARLGQCVAASRREFDESAADSGSYPSTAIRSPVTPDAVLENIIDAVFDELSRDPRPARILMWATLEADALDYEDSASAFQPVIDLLYGYLDTLSQSGLFENVDVEMAISLLHGMLAFQFIDRAGHRRFFRTDFSDPVHASRVKSEILRATRLLLGRPL